MDDKQRRELISQLGLTIAIDGPAGSGKSTISKILARRLGIGYLDTGAMYRALTWYALKCRIDLKDHDAVREAADEMPLSMHADPDAPSYRIGDIDVTQAIRHPTIALAIPQVSTNLQVRGWMAAQQRCRMKQAREDGSGMIAEGRDITTVVCPDADVRVLLVADEDERLRRRTREIYGYVSPELMEQVRDQITKRDAADATVSQFLAPAEGVDVVDSTGRDIDAVIEAILVLVDQNLEERSAR